MVNRDSYQKFCRIPTDVRNVATTKTISIHLGWRPSALRGVRRSPSHVFLSLIKTARPHVLLVAP